MKILTYNIFIGSPFETLYRNGTSTILRGDRIKNQINAIKIIDPDFANELIF